MKCAIIVAIVIVLNLFFNYAISLFYKAPQYSDYFPQSQVVEPIIDKASCLSVGGQWTDPNAQNTTGYCDPNYTNQANFDAAQKKYDRTVFIILVILGVLSLVGGALFTNGILSTSFSWGGVLALVTASMRYWSDADNLLKVLILAIALGMLIWVAVKKIGK